MTQPSNLTIAYDEKLKSICSRFTGVFLRPFSPHSQWNSTSCFIVGDRPATDVTASFATFEQYWHSLTIDTAKFEEKYWSHRRGIASKTVERLSVLKDAIGASNCLITNLCWYPARKYCLPPMEQRQRGSENLKLLMDTCGPRVLFFHGAGPVREAEKIFGITLDRFAPAECQHVVANGVRIFAYRNLSGPGRNHQETIDDIRKFGRVIADFLAAELPIGAATRAA